MGFAAAVLALAWVLELWLLVVGGAAATIALVRSRRWHRRTVLPAVVAGTAAAQSSGAVPAVAVEECAAIWLAAASGAHPHWLQQARRRVAAAEEDEWAAHVAITRLEAAEQALTEGRILGLRPPQRGHLAPGWRVVLWGIVAVALLVLAPPGGTWWLLPAAAALSGAALSLTELELSRAAPHLLAAEALTASGEWDDGEPSPLQLALLAEGDGRVIRRARRLVESANCEIPGREAALRQLRAAEAMTSQVGGRLLLFSEEGLPWWKPS